MDMIDPPEQPSQPAPVAEPAANGVPVRVRVKIPEEDLTYDTIKGAIYAQARYLFEKGQPIKRLLLSLDIYEILNRRLVFKTAAHKELPHFITPYGNLRVQKMDADLNEDLSFIIEG